ncbi:MAG: PhoX family protein [Gaiellaceae bacterium MAG52_C11]|nr:PhoX family protein [Candidatus Gaiellasilicea maunaloa]
MSTLDRRTLVRRAAAAGGTVLTAGVIERLNVREARAAAGVSSKGAAAVGYGAPVRMRDQLGREILALPPGFRYVTFGDIGAPMADGNTTGVALDGMACFKGHGSTTVRLIRNHEDRQAPGAGSVGGDPAAKYDAQAGGGTTTLDFDLRREELVRDFISLNGTIVNCAGGIAWRRRGWITGEETVQGPAQGWAQNHGYNYFVPLDREGPALTEPLRAMGRFAHEAVAVDQATGIVYQTEDAGSGRGSGFYRFIPDDRSELARGGKLQILAIHGRPQADLREGQQLGARLATEWVEIEDPDPAAATTSTVFTEGFTKGAAKFNRLEGCWEAHGTIFFASTSGGDAKNGDVGSDGFREGWGQIWQYRPRGRGRGTLKLIFESTDGSVLDGPDNLCVTPRDGLILCEDDPSSAYSATDTDPTATGITDVNRLIGLTEQGESFPFAVNTLNDTEFAGACFSPEGEWLFVNVFGDGTPGSGTTCAITGPWAHGPL